MQTQRRATTTKAMHDQRQAPPTRERERADDGAVVFLGEDDQKIRERVAGALRESGYHVVEATDGAEMLQLIRDAICDHVGTPDVIVMDARMPKRTGLWLLRAIRWSDWNVPVLLMTKSRDQAVRDEAARLRASAVFDKPCDVDALRSAVVNVQLEQVGRRTYGS